MLGGWALGSRCLALCVGLLCQDETRNISLAPSPNLDRRQLMTTVHVEHAGVLLVEFAPAAGLQQVALSPADLAERSRIALDSAMSAIQSMAGRVCQSIDDLAQRPAEVEVAFGLKLEASAGALIAKTSGEATLNVTMTWRPKESADGR
jgi:hypothetical protein